MESRLRRHYLPGMLEIKWGRVIFISSESGVQIPAEMIHYGMTKTAQLAVSRGLAETTAGTGVTVNTLMPGPTASEGANLFINSLAGQNNQTRDSLSRSFSAACGPAHCCGASRSPKRSPPWLLFSAARSHRPRMAQPCAPTAAWSAPSSRPCICWGIVRAERPAGAGASPRHPGLVSFFCLLGFHAAPRPHVLATQHQAKHICRNEPELLRVKPDNADDDAINRRQCPTFPAAAADEYGRRNG